MKEIELKSKKKKTIHPTRQIALSFFCVILIGSFLLSLPIANKGAATSFLNHLFVATSATCVTGLVPYPTVEQYTVFGQIVILILIQIGGLGFLTFLSVVFIRAKRRLSFNSKLVMQEALNVNTLNGLPAFVKNIVTYTFIIEGIGAIILATQFLRNHSFFQSVYMGIFHSVSAFCNAGFDIIGSDSLVPYQYNIIVNLVVCALIILGGLGFCVWFDLAEKIGIAKKRNKTKKQLFDSLDLHTKIVLYMTAFLLVTGTIMFFVLEFSNPDTIGGMPIGYKFLASIFQSTTLRTAGFATIDIASVNVATKTLMCIYMFIGGSPAGTAGGIKTVIVALTFATVRAVFNGENDTVLFQRRIDSNVLKRTFAVLMIAISIVLTGTVLLSIFENRNYIDLVFEVVSAFATVGLTASFTSGLSYMGKIVIIILMFIGRIGPITLIFSFMRKQQKNQGNVIFPKGEVIIG